jgi:hypothetical protein
VFSHPIIFLALDCDSSARPFQGKRGVIRILRTEAESGQFLPSDPEPSLFEEAFSISWDDHEDALSCNKRYT